MGCPLALVSKGHPRAVANAWCARILIVFFGLVLDGVCGGQVLETSISENNGPRFEMDVHEARCFARDADMFTHAYLPGATYHGTPKLYSQEGYLASLILVLARCHQYVASLACAPWLLACCATNLLIAVRASGLRDPVASQSPLIYHPSQ